MADEHADAVARVVAIRGNEPTDDAEPLPPTSWQPVDLAAAFDHREAKPTLLARDDGECLLYGGKVHWIVGESESCKTWLLVHAADEVVRRGGHVLWIDYEDSAATLLERLSAVGLTRRQIIDHVVFVAPEDALADHRGTPTRAWGDMGQTIESRGFALCVIDGITEAMGVEGLDLMSNTDVATFMARVPKRIAATGAAVACIDHVTKSNEGRGRWAIGGQHKVAGLDGCLFVLDVERPFYRARTSEPVEGRVSVRVGKDRPGWVRGNARGPYGSDRTQAIASFELVSFADDGVTLHLAAPSEDDATVDLALVRVIARHLAAYESDTTTNVEKGVGGRGSTVRSTLKTMAGRGWITIDKVGGAHRHTLTEQGRHDILEDT